MSEEQRRNAYDVLEVNKSDGTITIKINKGILGSLSNQLRATAETRKGSTIIRRMGFDLGAAGDILFGKENDNQDILNVVI